MQQRALPGLMIAVLVSLLLGVGYRYLTQGHPVTAATGRHSKVVAKAGTRVWFTLPETATRTDITIEPAALVGLAGRPVRAGDVLWRGWRVVSATEAEVHLLPVARSRPVYLGLKDGYVAIFLGPPQLGLIEEVTGIRAGGLLPADADRLKAGIGVPDLVHAWQLIQGLAP